MISFTLLTLTSSYAKRASSGFVSIVQHAEYIYSVVMARTLNAVAYNISWPLVMV